jgi:hypothetical protein
MGVFGDRILRCSDGHLFVSSEAGRLFGSLHLGPERLIQCPVDGEWRMAGNVRARTLTAAQLAEARKYRV